MSVKTTTTTQPDTATFVIRNINANRFLAYPALTKHRGSADMLSRFQARKWWADLAQHNDMCPAAGAILPAYMLRWYLVALNSVLSTENFVAEIVCTREELRTQLNTISENNNGVAVIAVEVFTGEDRATLHAPAREIVWSKQYTNDTEKVNTAKQTA